MHFNENDNQQILEEEQVSTTDNVEGEKELSLEEQLAEMKDRWMRTMADLENLRRRSQREKEEALKYGAVGFAREMVNVADNIKRAVDSKPDEQDLSDAMKSYLAGVEMIAKEFISAFEKQGIKVLDSMHKPFDPNCHQAIFEVPTNEHPVGTILQVIQEGYMMHDRLLRPALVGVAKQELKESDQVAS